MSKTIFCIAGEASGDALGGPLLKAIAQAQPDIKFTGIGGPRMEEAGLKSQMPMNDICVMGLFEVLSHLPRLHKILHGLAEQIEAEQPDVLLTIDLPDFNFYLAKLLKKRGKFQGEIIHYVAPTVWAWRPGRAKKISKFLDGLICLFPFEPRYFLRHGLDAVFVGHSLVDAGIERGDGIKFRTLHEIPAEVKTLGLFLGSRPAEIQKHGSIFKDAIKAVAEQGERLNVPELQIIVPTLPHLEYEVLKLLEDMPYPVNVSTDTTHKWDAFKACDVAVAVSGTVGLELAYAGVPHMIGYRVSWPSYVLLKLLIKAKYAHLANILLDKPVIPEYLQQECEPLTLAKGLLNILCKPEKAGAQKEAFARLPGLLGAGKNPAEKAARFVVKAL